MLPDAVQLPVRLAGRGVEGAGEAALLHDEELIADDERRGEIRGGLVVHVPEDVRLGHVARAAAADRLDDGAAADHVVGRLEGGVEFARR